MQPYKNNLTSSLLNPYDKILTSYVYVILKKNAVS